MKKLILLIPVLFLVLSLFSQSKTTFEDITIFKNENISSNSAFCYHYTNNIWVNDFSNQNDWIKSSTNNSNWAITNKGPKGKYSMSMGQLKTKFPENEFALFDADNFGNNAEANIATNNYITIKDYNNVFVSFVQKYKCYNTDKTFICISTDGFYWTDIEINSSLNNNETAINRIFVDISTLVYGKNNLWIKFKYVGSEGYAWMIDDVVVKGVLDPMANIISLNPNEGFQGQSLNVTLSGQLTNFTQGSQTVWFEQASQTIMSGENILVASLTEMSFDLNIPLSAPVGMYNVKTENLTDGILTLNSGFEVLQLTTPPSWNYSNTGNNHQILVPVFATITIDGLPIENGDYIGVFYDSLETLACAGYFQWQGATSSLAAWGDNTITLDKDGFDVGEPFTWKIWDASAGVEYHAFATYQATGFANTDTYAINGASGISALEGILLQTQTINLISGWSIISTYIDPLNPLCEDIFAAISSNVTIVKNGAGQVFWPAFGVNIIGNVLIGEGYQINTITTDLLNIEGVAVVPENTPFNIPVGWSIIGYLRQSPADASLMLSSIVSDVVILKNSIGQVYWPYWGINDIGNLNPGEGYQINTSNAVTLTYPANNQTSKLSFNSSYELDHFSKPVNTGNNMTLLILESAWPIDIVHGDEIGIFNTSGNIVGSAVYSNNNLPISVWGKDILIPNSGNGLVENEIFEIRIWQQSTNTVIITSVVKLSIGSAAYTKDGISVIDRLGLTWDNELFQNSPNPCSNYTNIGFKLNQANNISLDIYDISGKLIYQVVKEYINANEYNYSVDVSEFENGKYIYTLHTDKKTYAKQFIVIK